MFQSTRGSLITRPLDFQYITSEKVLFLCIDPNINETDAETDLFYLQSNPCSIHISIHIITKASLSTLRLDGEKDEEDVKAVRGKTENESTNLILSAVLDVLCHVFSFFLFIFDKNPPHSSSDIY